MTTERSASLLPVYTLSTGLVLGGVFIGMFADSWLGVSESLAPKYEQTDIPLIRINEVPPFDELASVSDPVMPEEFDVTEGLYELAAHEIVIELGRDGRVSVSGQSMGIANLKAFLCSAVQRQMNDLLVTIKPHDDCLFQYVMNVIEVCDDCDVSNYKIAGKTVGDPLGAIRI